MYIARLTIYNVVNGALLSGQHGPTCIRYHLSAKWSKSFDP